MSALRSMELDGMSSCRQLASGRINMCRIDGLPQNRSIRRLDLTVALPDMRRARSNANHSSVTAPR